MWERFLVNGLQHSDTCVLCKSICHTVDATTLHLELFQMAAPLYVSRLLLRVIRIGVKACIDVTLYNGLFITSIIEKYFLSPLVTKDNLDRCPVIHSWTTLVPLDRLMARHTQVRYTAWHTIQSLWIRHRGQPSSFLFFLPWSSFESHSTPHLTNQARTLSLTDPFWTLSKSCQGMYLLKVL